MDSELSKARSEVNSKAKNIFRGVHFWTGRSPQKFVAVHPKSRGRSPLKVKMAVHLKWECFFELAVHLVRSLNSSNCFVPGPARFGPGLIGFGPWIPAADTMLLEVAYYHRFGPNVLDPSFWKKMRTDKTIEWSMTVES